MRFGILVFLYLWLILNGQLLSQDHHQNRSLKKLSPSLRVQGVPIQVQLKVTDSIAFKHWMELHYPKVEFRNREGVFFIRSLPGSLFQSLLELDLVTHIDRADRVAREETLLGDFDFSLNGITATQALFPNLNGNGLVVSIKEKPFDQNDIDLRGRIVDSDQFDEPATLHATFMATLAAGAGNTSPFAKGGGWGAGITTSDFGQLLPDNGVQLANLGVTVQNHSYGVGLENYYGIESSEYDAACIEYPEILHVFSSGNQGLSTDSQGAYAGIPGVANLTGQFKISKNTLAVGSSDRYGNAVLLSSRGPAHDGRIKPELIAFGDAGSSEAAAVVSGITLQVQQAYYNTHGVLPDAALVKAILINSAKDTGRPHVDFETGFGNANALGALRTVEDGRFFSGEVIHDAEFVVEISVPANQQALKVTLVWADPPAEPLVDRALINDLDLTIRHVEANETWQPWILNTNPLINDLHQPAQRGTDRLNNVEQVSISMPTEGTYEIRIKAFNVTQGAQRFHIAYEYDNGFEWTFPVEGNALRAAQNTILRWNWNTMVAGEGILSFKYDTEMDWTLIQTNINLTGNYFEWSVPDTSALVQLRMTVDGDGFESVVFPISKPERVRVGFNCDHDVFLFWNQIPSASEYLVYALGDQYLEPFQTTPDSFAIIPKTFISTNYFSVAPVINGKTGLRELTVDYTQQGTGCYFVSVLPHVYFVSDSAVIDVTLGTTYSVQSAQLQLLVFGSFQSVSVQSTVISTVFSLRDNSPQSGRQTYRVALTLNGGELVFSDPVEIFVIYESDIYIYPNPVYVGQDINILTSQEDESLIELVDSNGRTVKMAEDFGNVKILSTHGLSGSLYFLRIHQADGRVRIGKVIVLK